MKRLNRRRFLGIAAASIACGMENCISAQGVTEDVVETRLELGAPAGATMPLDFIGLSYESAQLADPTFFSARNTGLVEQFRSLSTSGSLRLGGCLSDFTNWWDPATQPQKPAMTPALAAGQKRFEWIMTTPSVSKDKYAVITPECIEQLRGFLDATGWNVIYGLNLGAGTAQRAGVEGSCAAHVLGKKLAALQVGNEADYFMHWKRPLTWGFDDYWNEYSSFVNAVHEHAPKAPFAGPDSAFMPWLQLYAERAQHEPVFLSSHYYRMGPTADPRSGAEKLLSPDPKLQAHVQAARQAMSVCGLPYRMTEANSCAHGGMAGVSDAYASALWVIDFMLQGAQGGFSGINLHGGGMEGVYSPIVGDAETGYTARPITVGMKFVNRFAGAAFATTQFTTGGCNATAYAARRDNETLIAIVNMDPKAIKCTVDGSFAAHTKEAQLLSAPGLNATSGIELRAVGHKGKTFLLPAYTALLVRAAS